MQAAPLHMVPSYAQTRTSMFESSVKEGLGGPQAPH